MNQYAKYIYWVEKEKLYSVKSQLKSDGYRISKALKTPCEVLNAKDKKVMLGAPEVWSLVCKRQGSWYRESNRAGKYLLVSAERLPTEFDEYLDARITESNVTPVSLPTENELHELIRSKEYQTQKPKQWEKIKLWDAVLFKTLFLATRFWGLKDNLGKHWIGHRANHANFLNKRFSLEIDGDTVPYSVTENSRVCSSCVEFFNVTSQDTRKLVRGCPGAITFSDVNRDTYYDVKPVKFFSGKNVVA